MTAGDSRARRVEYAELLAAADAALYVAKRAGKHRTVAQAMPRAA